MVADVSEAHRDFGETLIAAELLMLMLNVVNKLDMRTGETVRAHRLDETPGSAWIEPDGGEDGQFAIKVNTTYKNNYPLEQLAVLLDPGLDGFIGPYEIINVEVDNNEGTLCIVVEQPIDGDSPTA